MFDLELFTQLCHHLVIKIGPIISDDLVWNPISAYDLFLDEASNDLLGHVLVRSSFDPFGEVVDSNKNKSVSIRSLRLYPSNHVYAPHSKGPRRCQDIQRSRRNMNSVSIHLTFVTFLHIHITITFNRHPIISCSQDLFGHRMSTGMSSKRSFMNFPRDQFCFVSIHASEQN